MKIYTCVCGQMLFFQNVACVNCKRELGFLPDFLWLTSLEPADNNLWRATAKEANGSLYKKCPNYAKEGVCNWMIPETEQGDSFCASCQLNETIPDLDSEQNRNSWARIENAKRRLVYSLIRLRLPIAPRKNGTDQGLGFRFLADVVKPDGTVSKVIIGHERGIITLNIAEADDAMRESVRNAMKEPYRTLLGHFRHESGHYYWDRLVRNTNFLESFRSLFGDERADYNQALQAHYQTGAPAHWQDTHISAYATAHPWEDWAETWAHFLHIQDVMEVANDFSLVGKRILLDPRQATQDEPNGEHITPDDKLPDSHLKRSGDRIEDLQTTSSQNSFEQVITSWAEMTVALNSINRCMGLPDLYPFVLSPAVVSKLRFVYDIIVENSAPARQNSQSAGS